VVILLKRISSFPKLGLRKVQVEGYMFKELLFLIMLVCFLYVVGEEN
jgi:hypothetical protein